MRTNRATIMMAAFLAVILVAGAALAAGPKAQRTGPADPYTRLTPEKQAAAEKIFDKHKDKLADLREAMWAKQTELNALVQSGKAEKKDIQDLVAEIAKLHKDQRTERNALRDELTKETGIKAYGHGRGECGGMGGCGGPCAGGEGGGMGGMMGGMGTHRGMGWNQ